MPETTQEELRERELDFAVALRIMDFSWRAFPNGRSLVPHKTAPLAKGDEPIHPNSGSQVPRYSELISDAMEIVERLRHAGVWTKIMIYHQTSQVRVEMGVPSSECQEWGATAAEAICKCALKAYRKFEYIADALKALDHKESE